MKKYVSAALALLLTFACCAALAEATVTPLPLNTRFGMNMTALEDALGTEDAVKENWYEDDDEIGAVTLRDVKLGVGDLVARDIYFQVDRNNSQKEPRMCMISVTLEHEGGVNGSFRKALATMTEAYGQPDADPFDESGVQNYVEYGTLSATWTKPDVRINLTSYNRMYDEALSIDYSYRLNYDAKDLEQID